MFFEPFPPLLLVLFKSFLWIRAAAAGRQCVIASKNTITLSEIPDGQSRYKVVRHLYSRLSTINISRFANSGRHICQGETGRGMRNSRDSNAAVYYVPSGDVSSTLIEKNLPGAA
ncbi:hypothetical protein DFH08DRAFT_816565 [Mycena albidolilacea]|uniref:Secreted protein n=1 Tax=Mycena albidolilacea TaxID=1033008 RepID=A0AAD6ZKA8_9AGAR|nr:hypothetical protein DFH08DRAFT_816565 [Mycena albidolilacea]